MVPDFSLLLVITRLPYICVRCFGYLAPLLSHMTIFSRIVSGEIPAYKVAETDRFLAFLDVQPLTEGHTLCIPKQEIDFIFDLDEQTHADLWSFAREVAQKLKRSVPAERIAVAVIGLEVPHAHIHLVPINQIADLNFKNPRLSLTPERMAELARHISGWGD